MLRHAKPVGRLSEIKLRSTSSTSAPVCGDRSRADYNSQHACTVTRELLLIPPTKKLPNDVSSPMRRVTVELQFGRLGQPCWAPHLPGDADYLALQNLLFQWTDATGDLVL